MDKWLKRSEDNTDAENVKKKRRARTNAKF